MDFNEAVEKITSVIKEETGIPTSVDDGAPAWSNRQVHIKVTKLPDGLKVRIYDDQHLNFQLYANLTESDVALTARTIVRELEREK
jgi:hypothetical protein